MPRETPESSKAAEMESLKKRHKVLNDQRITAEANLSTATTQLTELKDEAQKLYGTDDLDELRKKLQQMRDENERKRAEYQAHLEQIEAKLAEVNAKFSDS